MKKKKTGYETLCLILLIILALLFIFPLYWIVTGSVKDKADILIKSGQSVQWLPLSPTMANYQSLMKNQVTMVLFGIGSSRCRRRSAG
jgi:multiple sugar transport system permease protein